MWGRVDAIMEMMVNGMVRGLVFVTFLTFNVALLWMLGATVLAAWRSL